METLNEHLNALVSMDNPSISLALKVYMTGNIFVCTVSVGSIQPITPTNQKDVKYWLLVPRMIVLRMKYQNFKSTQCTESTEVISYLTWSTTL